MLDRFLHDVQTQTVYPTTGDAKRASEAVDDIINNVNLIDELNVSIMLTSIYSYLWQWKRRDQN